MKQADHLIVKIKQRKYEIVGKIKYADNKKEVSNIK